MGEKTLGGALVRQKKPPPPPAQEIRAFTRGVCCYYFPMGIATSER